MAVALWLAGCSDGGELTLESGARKIASRGSPFVAVNQGGRALIVQNGKTASTGVHGWVTVQSISARNMTSASGTGHSMIVNKPSAFR